MAIIVDERAQALVDRRRAHGDDARILVKIEPLRSRAGLLAGTPDDLIVGWMPRRWPQCTLVARNVGDITVYLDPRIARYTTWNDLTISGWHLGPIDHLNIDPMAIFAIRDWEYTHPEERRPAVAPTTPARAAGM